MVDVSLRDRELKRLLQERHFTVSPMLAVSGERQTAARRPTVYVIARQEEEGCMFGSLVQ